MADYSQMSDRELLDNNSADTGKIAEIISRYMKVVFAAAVKYSASADREELVSDGMQALMNAVQSYNAEKGEFSAYVNVCIGNRLKTTVKKSLAHKVKVIDEDEADLAKVPDKKPSPEEILIAREDSEEMLKFMRNNLTELEFRCIDGVIMGLTYEKIGEILRIDKKSVDNAVTRARAKLRKFYEK